VSYIWIALGAGLGGVLRYWCSGVAARLGAETFPWGTLFINVLGSSFIGFFATFSGPEGRALVAPNTRLFVMTGVCGGYTTFSTFSLETLRLMQDREWGYAALNVAASVGLCLLGVWLGHQLATSLNQR
jgi:fluoride exporter